MEPRYKVLVAEDDPFQRYIICEMLKISGYIVTDVEDGQKAIDKLRDPNNYFDLVLLDLLMPIKSGKEVLEEIIKDEKLSKIPVIMLSAKSDKSITAECLGLGAKSFVPKPLRLPECKSFINFIESTSETETERDLAKYEFISYIGGGACGEVNLVKHKDSGSKYACKTICLEKLDQSGRESALLEVHFLKVLIGPTLIKSYQSYINKDKIHIIMEYAEGGNLSDRITSAKLKKMWFDTSSILDWISQIILGVQLMHSKNIIHRDLKSQNLFLTKDGVIKIGDFGISKELDTIKRLVETGCGTPYFMSPEVVRGEPYGEKADVWAIGVILYEMTFLCKPFDGVTFKEVFDKIRDEPISLSIRPIDTDIEMLLLTLLNKDPSKRPDINEIAEIPSINDRILKFVKEHDCEESVKGFFNIKNSSDNIGEHVSSSSNIFGEDRLDMLAHLIRADIEMEEAKSGWFQKAEKCGNDDKKAEEIGQKMLDHGIIQRIDGEEEFHGNYSILYKFHEDRDDIASNLLRYWNGEVDDPIDVSVSLLQDIGEIYKDAIEEGEEAFTIEYEQALGSKKYDSFISKVCQLEIVDLEFKTYNEALCFFLNVYQCMLIHYLLKKGNNFIDMKEETKGNFIGIMNYFWPKPEQSFFYNIGGMNFTLEELKHGLLRGNSKPPGSFFRLLNASDTRTTLLTSITDPRTLFICLDKHQLPEAIECFDDPTTIDTKLDEILSGYFNEKIEIDTTNEEIIIPTVFDIYSADFGGSDEKILRFIWKWYETSEMKLQEVLRLVRRKSLMIKYED
ncbi:unnamed protein product [Moneuplotes crassus]|uniref:non-specific serine/threonine protein kinase n=1 Tax=Euplotes crassus TaxID=5936 RepID=A0AAD1Y4S7_EUPCR|nr:unnamed protein product [Moneuplotes crassus]